METNVLLGITNCGCALLAIGLAWPLLRRRIGPNAFYGVRFPKAFRSEQTWYDANEYGARRLIRWSGVLLAVGIATFFVPLEEHRRWTLPFALAPLLFLVPAIESWLWLRRL